MLAAVAGCSKIDTGACWSAETKELLHQRIVAQSSSTQQQVDQIQLRNQIIRQPNMGLIDIAATDFNLEKIDKVAGSADCSFEYSVSVNYGNEKLRGGGRIPFSLRPGESGRVLSISADSMRAVISELRKVTE